MEKEFLVKPIGIKYICDTCNEGEMIPTGENNWLTNPPNFNHKCNKCGKELLLSDKYPIIRYKEID